MRRGERNERDARRKARENAPRASSKGEFTQVLIAFESRYTILVEATVAHRPAAYEYIIYTYIYVYCS